MLRVPRNAGGRNAASDCHGNSVAVRQYGTRTGCVSLEYGYLEPATAAYTFEANEGEEVEVELRSEEFNTLLTVRAPSGDEFENDDFDETNSEVTFTAEKTGMYEVIVKGYNSDAGGAYSVSIETSRPYWERQLDALIRRLQRLEDLHEFAPEP